MRAQQWGRARCLPRPPRQHIDRWGRPSPRRRDAATAWPGLGAPRPLPPSLHPAAPVRRHPAGRWAVRCRLGTAPATPGAAPGGTAADAVLPPPSRRFRAAPALRRTTRLSCCTGGSVRLPGGTRRRTGPGTGAAGCAALLRLHAAAAPPLLAGQRAFVSLQGVPRRAALQGARAARRVGAAGKRSMGGRPLGVAGWQAAVPQVRWAPQPLQRLTAAAGTCPLGTSAARGWPHRAAGGGGRAGQGQGRGGGRWAAKRRHGRPPPGRLASRCCSPCLPAAHAAPALRTARCRCSICTLWRNASAAMAAIELRGTRRGRRGAVGMVLELQRHPKQARALEAAAACTGWQRQRSESTGSRRCEPRRQAGRGGRARSGHSRSDDQRVALPALGVGEEAARRRPDLCTGAGR